jgi:hypothetical protein
LLVVAAVALSRWRWLGSSFVLLLRCGGWLIASFVRLVTDLLSTVLRFCFAVVAAVRPFVSVGLWCRLVAVDGLLQLDAVLVVPFVPFVPCDDCFGLHSSSLGCAPSLFACVCCLAIVLYDANGDRRRLGRSLVGDRSQV